MRVVIVDFGAGNLASLRHKLGAAGVAAEIASTPAGVEAADALLLPGIGHFARAMANLRDLGLAEALERKVAGAGTPILGICVGMQIFARRSEEGDAEGLGWLDADVVRFRFGDGRRVPHIGWAALRPSRPGRPDPLLEGVSPDRRFYFIHSYHVVCRDPSDVVATADYGVEFAAAVRRRNVFGTQFHPEKSHRRGLEIVRNFLRAAGAR
jgi:glutamine amidotransferase